MFKSLFIGRLEYKRFKRATAKLPTDVLHLQCKHPFHMVKSSLWPFVTSQTLFVFILALVNFFHYTIYSALGVFISFVIFLLPIFFWFRDIIHELTYMGLYAVAVQKNLRLVMMLLLFYRKSCFFKHVSYKKKIISTKNVLIPFLVFSMSNQSNYREGEHKYCFTDNLSYLDSAKAFLGYGLDFGVLIRVLIGQLSILILYGCIKILFENINFFFQTKSRALTGLCFNNLPEKSVFDTIESLDGLRRFKPAGKTICEFLNDELEKVLNEIKEKVKTDDSTKFLCFIVVLFFACCRYYNLYNNEEDIISSTNMYDIIFENLALDWEKLVVAISLYLVGFGRGSRELSLLFARAGRLRRLMEKAGCKKKNQE